MTKIHDDDLVDKLFSLSILKYLVKFFLFLADVNMIKKLYCKASALAAYGSISQESSH
jgi:hypothetical protein